MKYYYNILLYTSYVSSINTFMYAKLLIISFVTLMLVHFYEDVLLRILCRHKVCQ